NVYLIQKQYPPAIAAFQKAVQVKPDFWEAINNLGLVSYEQGDRNQALNYWNRAIELSKDAAEPVLAKAVLVYQQGQTEEAVRLAQQALGKD
ncbi:tetratricopeptide repeat protein, partial [Klebsiella pneumoniae]|nr:tetratricopeptide repeat protein [Klebsiella pneumoniae]